jgi:hypothetical protein
MAVAVVLVLVVVMGSALWVSIDNDKMNRQYGRPTATRWWVIGCLLVWGFVFPAYLIYRFDRRRGGVHPPPMPVGTPDVAGPREWIPNPEDPRYIVYWDGTRFTEQRPAYPPPPLSPPSSAE